MDLEAEALEAVTLEAKTLLGSDEADAFLARLEQLSFDILGPLGQVRVVKLTAEGPQFPPQSLQPAPDPL